MSGEGLIDDRFKNLPGAVGEQIEMKKSFFIH
jgi:hypothetical protein